MSEPDSEYIARAEFVATVPSTYGFSEAPPDLTPAERKYHEQIRRALITALRAEDERLGRTQTIPRQER